MNWQKITAAGLVSAMSVSLAPKISGNDIVSADSVKNSSNTILNTSYILNPSVPESEESPWTGNYVYFGEYENKPIRFRVLNNYETGFGGTSLFLDSDEILYKEKFDDDSNEFDSSDIQSDLSNRFENSAFNSQELNAIMKSTISSHDYNSAAGSGVAVDNWIETEFGKYVFLDENKVFLLDFEDVSNPVYGYSNYPTECKNHQKKKDGSLENWWVRSAMSDYSKGVGIVNWAGKYFFGDSYETDKGIAPALNVDLESILFSTLVNGEIGKTDAEYKLTVKDDDLKIAVKSGKTVTAEEKTISIPYSISGDDAEAANRVSVFILNKEYTPTNSTTADIEYYEELNYAEFNVDSTGTFTLPSSFDLSGWGTDYYVYITAEQINGDKKTDFASEPVLLDKPVVPNKVITSANCTITKPHEGDKMDVNPVSDDPSKYEVQFDCWYVCSDPDYPPLNTTDTFKAGKTYAVRIYFIAKDGYELDNNTKLTINGEIYGKYTTLSPNRDRLGIEARFVTTTDTPYTGWVENGLGWKYYESGNPVTGWKQIGGFWYHFKESGNMQKNWKQIDGTWYYLGSNGAMRTGWQEISGTWYYFGDNGAMRKSWQQISGKWYYFTGSGAMVTGWQKIGEVWYYFESSGAMVTGWKEISGVYYFFKSNGAMASNEYCGGYWLDASGAWTYKYKASWKHDATGWWYGDDSGWYAKNRTLKIDGKDYNFNASGYCTNP